MLYLFSFLTMLIGLLIYMMDPVPTDLRRKENVAGAEAYIVGFVNQHQAAKDYLYQWLGRVYPFDNTKVETYSTANNFNAPDDWAASVVAIPGDALDKAMYSNRGHELNLTVERQVGNPTTDVIGHLRPRTDATKKGSYFSALMCLNASGALTQCYKYDCDGTTGQSSCSNKSAIRKISFADGVKPYAITYSTLEKPDWWDDKVPPKPLRQRLWYRALTNRTHASESCGVLLYADTTGHWEKRTRNRVDWKEGNTAPKYCISNGQRCVYILPTGVESFLRSAFNAASEGDLEDIFVCMSVYKDPYEGTPTFNYDGIDHYATGGAAPDFNNVWYPVVGNGELPVARWGGDAGWFSVNNQFALTSTSGSVVNGFTMPFKHTTNNFTLTFIMNFGGAFNGNSGWYVGPDTASGGGYFGIHQNGDIWVHPHQGLGENPANPGNLAPRFTETAAGPSNVNITGPEYYTKGTHSWTIVRENNKMFLYLDGWQVCTAEPDGSWEAETTPSGPAPYVVIGALPTSIGAVRYYASALNRRQIKKNFKVDSRRYGIIKQKSPGGDAFCEIVPPTP